MTDGVNLAAIEEIRALKARYVRALDTKDWPLLRTLLTDDMVGDFREMPGGMPDEKLLTTGADAFVAGVAAELDEATTVHHVHSFEIRFTGARDAEGGKHNPKRLRLDVFPQVEQLSNWAKKTPTRSKPGGRQMKISGVLKGRALLGRTARISGPPHRELYGNAKSNSAVKLCEPAYGNRSAVFRKRACRAP